MNADRRLRNIRSSRAYRRLRRTIMGRDPLCRRCRRRGFTIQADELHHIVPVAENPDLSMDPDNLEPLCWRCHYAETTKQRKRIVGATLEGDLVDQKEPKGERGDRRIGESDVATSPRESTGSPRFQRKEKTGG